VARYSQLTQEQRYQIYELHHEGKTPAAIARALGVHRSTIGRELARNSGERNYRPHQAQEWAAARRHKPRRPRKLIGRLKRTVEQKLALEWSPEQIAGWLERKRRPSVSHETIYLHVWADKAAGGDLHKHLRRAHKRYRKRYGAHDRRGQIPGRRGIEQRPRGVEGRRRVGHWELDTMLGRQQSQAVVNAVERRTRYTRLAKVAQRRADAVAAAVVRMLGRHRDQVRTLTADNGREFAGHQSVSRRLEAKFYFARPYHAWERGTCENTIGLIRQYAPKRRSLDNIGPRELRFIMRRLNNRPRKCLGFRTPHEVFFGIKT
jgi:transposase, IS30 family